MSGQEFTPVNLTGPRVDELLDKWTTLLNDFVRQNNACAGIMMGLMFDGIRHCHFEHPIEGYTDDHLVEYFRKFLSDARIEFETARRSKLQ